MEKVMTCIRYDNFLLRTNGVALTIPRLCELDADGFDLFTVFLEKNLGDGGGDHDRQIWSGQNVLGQVGRFGRYTGSVFINVGHCPGSDSVV